MKKIYFAGSIRGGREDANLYKQIIEYIQRSHKVLTEHIGNRSLSTTSKGREADEKIYLQDTEWLRGCDLVIAECTSPSLGVGYELAYAERHHKPCFILYDKSRTHLSAMLTGNKYYHIFAYEHPEEVFDILDKILGNTSTHALSTNHRQTT